MNSFENNLLNKLLDKFESSKLSKGGTAVSRSIRLTTKDDVLSSYVAQDSYKYADENDTILRELESKNFIKVEWEYDTFKSLTLNLDNVNLIYEYVNREKPTNELDRIKEVLGKYKFEGFINDFIDYVTNYINTKYDYPKSYFVDSVQLDLILNIFKNLFKLEEDTKKREFSAKYLGDSKLFESVQGKVIKIIKDFDTNSYNSDEEVLEAYNIVKNTSYAILKNKLVFKLNDCIIDLDKLGFEYLLSDEMIKKMEIIVSNVNKVITVENLTSFYSLFDNDSVIIYLGGFHNNTKQALIDTIYKKYPHASFYHFGDIDAGGFQIFINLVDKTGVKFKPYKMGVDELNTSKKLKRLTDNDKKRLRKMLLDSKYYLFYDQIKYMLENNVKMEQENLD